MKRRSPSPRRLALCLAVCVLCLSLAAAELVPAAETAALTATTEADFTAAEADAAADTAESAEASADATADTAESAEVSIRAEGLTLLAHSLRYPQVDSLADGIAETVNEALRQASGIEALTARLPLVMGSDMPLNSDYRAYLHGDVLSCVCWAEGPLQDEAWSMWTNCVSLDLTTGDVIPLTALFAEDDLQPLNDALAAVAADLSAHIFHDELTAASAEWAFDPSGLTLYYPLNVYTTLSGRAGLVHFTWGELRDSLNLAEDSILARAGIPDSLTLTADSAAAWADWASAGALPWLPVTMGDALQPLKEQWGLATDPDYYTDGRYISLDDGRFRDIWLMTDRLSYTSVEHSVVQGIRLDRVSLAGLCTGLTTQAEWRAAFGQPDATITVDADMAEGLRMVPGTSDYYSFGTHRLRLHANADGVLTTVMLL